MLSNRIKVFHPWFHVPVNQKGDFCNLAPFLNSKMFHKVAAVCKSAHKVNMFKSRIEM